MYLEKVKAANWETTTQPLIALDVDDFIVNSSTVIACVFIYECKIFF